MRSTPVMDMGDSLCLAVLATLTTLSGCSDTTPLSVTEKARFTAELIDARHECASFAERLAVPAISESGIAETYEAAKTAHCLKPDV